VSRWTPRPALSPKRSCRVDEAADVAVELLRETHEARQVCLPRLLALPELLGHLVEEPLRDGDLAHDLTGRPASAPERLQQPAGRVAREQRRALERDPGVVERLLELARARVRTHEHRHLLERDAAGM
jgi:hypothetical protein